MIDHFSIALTHGLMLLAAWRLLARGDLDRDAKPGESGEAPGWRARPTRRKAVPPDA